MLRICRKAAKQVDTVLETCDFMETRVEVDVDPQITNGSSGSDVVVADPGWCLGYQMLSLIRGAPEVWFSDYIYNVIIMRSWNKYGLTVMQL